MEMRKSSGPRMILAGGGYNAQGVVVGKTLNTPEYQDAREADGVGQHLCQWQGVSHFLGINQTMIAMRYCASLVKSGAVVLYHDRATVLTAAV